MGTQTHIKGRCTFHRRITLVFMRDVGKESICVRGFLAHTHTHTIRAHQTGAELDRLGHIVGMPSILAWALKRTAVPPRMCS